MDTLKERLIQRLYPSALVVAVLLVGFGGYVAYRILSTPAGVHYAAEHWTLLGLVAGGVVAALAASLTLLLTPPAPEPGVPREVVSEVVALARLVVRAQAGEADEPEANTQKRATPKRVQAKRSNR